MYARKFRAPLNPPLLRVNQQQLREGNRRVEEQAEHQDPAFAVADFDILQ